MGFSDKMGGLRRMFNKESDGLTASERGISGGPQRSRGASSGALGSWMRMDDDSEGVGRTLYIVRGSQLFFVFVAICINAAMTAFQKKWNVGPSGLVVLTFFVAVLSFLFSLAMLLIPVFHERSGRLNGLASGIKRPRPAFIINCICTTLMLIMAFVLTISSNTKGCKDADKDNNSQLEGYKEALPSFCRSKRALTAFLWFAFFAWLASLSHRSAPVIPAFTAPEEEDKGEGSLDGDGGSHRYDSLPSAGGHIPYAGAASPVYSTGGFGAPAAARQSTTFYEGGRPFEDPTPTGYGSSPYTNPYEASPNYDDPYERIRRERGA